MKKFRFNMKTLLIMRKQEEDAAKKEVVLARMQLKKILEILQELQSECNLLEEDLRRRQRSKQSVCAFHDYFLYLDFLRRKIVRRQDDVLEAQNIVEEKRKAAKKSMQKKKILENIKDKKYAEWNDHYRRLETKILDELATIKYIREEGKLSYES